MEKYIQDMASAGGTARAAKLTPAERKKIASAGGKALARMMSPEARRASALHAITARWAKVKRKKA